MKSEESFVADYRVLHHAAFPVETWQRVERGAWRVGADLGEQQRRTKAMMNSYSYKVSSPHSPCEAGREERKESREEREQMRGESRRAKRREEGVGGEGEGVVGACRICRARIEGCENAV